MLGGIFDYSSKCERLEEVELLLANPKIWETPEKAIELGNEQSKLQFVLDDIKFLEESTELIKDLLEYNDTEFLLEVENTIKMCLEALDRLEFNKMFNNQLDKLNCYIDIQAGSGGTESQDWSQMLLRMYLRYAEQKGFSTEIIDEQQGDVAGIKSCTIKITGDYAFGWLRTENGVHRLVRKSPFDSNNKRHTSFSAVFVYPEIDSSIDITVNKSDVREDTYRASGAGGQHVNKTDSAIRLTHIPTGIVVQCQNQRSQHANRDQAWKQLYSKLYDLEKQKQESEKQKQESEKLENGWGSQIRSYVLDDSRIKDLRTNYETRNTQSVLDGDLDQFIIKSLKTL